MAQPTNAAMTRCMKTYCGKVWPAAQKRLLRTLTGRVMTFIKKNKTLKPGKKFKAGFGKGFLKIRQDLEVCRRAHCNPGCKGTIFQDGKAFPKEVEELAKKQMSGIRGIKTKTQRDALKMIVSLAKATRKTIFKGKSSVLRSNSFYKKLPRKNVTRAKSRGAVSGCAMQIFSGGGAGRTRRA
jgi:hypothetical protein